MNYRIDVCIFTILIMILGVSCGHKSTDAEETYIDCQTFSVGSGDFGPTEIGPPWDADAWCQAKFNDANRIAKNFIRNQEHPEYVSSFDCCLPGD